MLLTLLAGAFVLGVVILVHEFGHFIVAKWAGVYVKVFSIGFGKKLLKRRRGETVYAISALPFGGYVKFAGETEYYDDVEKKEAEEKEQPEPPGPTDEVPDSEIPRERYFTEKPALSRAAILFAGPFMNYLLAVLLYIGLSWIHGSPVNPSTTIGEIAVGSPADSVGLKAGDRIVAIDGEQVHNWGDIVSNLHEDRQTTKTLVVDREGREMSIECVGSLDSSGHYRVGIIPHIPPRIGRVQRDKPAYRAGIREGALIESINDTTLTSFDDLMRIVNANPEVPLFFRWQQDGEVFADSIVPDAIQAPKAGITDEFVVVGVVGLSPSSVQRRESLPASIVLGFNSANDLIVRIVGYLGLLFTGQLGVETLGGPILITQMAGNVARWGFDYLLGFLAFFSVNLCIFNLIPLLPFDGGHLALLSFEVVARRPVNRRLRDIFAQAGFVLIILLMVFVILLDLNRCSGSSPGFF